MTVSEARPDAAAPAATENSRAGTGSLLHRYWLKHPLWLRILVAMLAGLATGTIWGEGAAQIKWLGDLFIRLLRMLVVPLVFTLVVAGVSSIGESRRLGRLGVWTFALYLAMIVTGVCLGLVLATLLRPGAALEFASAGMSAERLEAAPRGLLLDQLMAIVPLNPVEALASGNLLSVIFFAILLGAGIALAAEAGLPLAALFRAGSAVMLRLVSIVMETAPIGVFALVTWVAGTAGIHALTGILTLALCVLIGSTIQTLVAHGTLVRIGAGLRLRRFYGGVAPSMLMAFTTCSSSATLPVSLSVSGEKLGIAPPVASIVLPLGITIGQDGTAMYIAILAVLGAQLFGIDLSPADYLAVAAVTTVVAFGMAPVPSASLFLLAPVLETIGLDDSQAALLVGLILPFDRILDMIRTVPNVTCDLAVATFIARRQGAIDLGVYAGTTAWNPASRDGFA